MYDIEEVEEMKKKALEFAQKSTVVRESFRRWLKLTMDRAAYLEARKRGDEYRQKLQHSNHARQQSILQSSKNVDSLDKKRRISTNGRALALGDSPSPLKKRARKRMSGEYRPPRTDEDLAKRFKEVQTVFLPLLFLNAFIIHGPDSNFFFYLPSSIYFCSQSLASG